MKVKHHLTTEQARQFSDEFGNDWQWSHPSIARLSRELGIDLEHEFNVSSAKVSGWNQSLATKTNQNDG